MSTYSNRLQPALQNLLQRVVRFFHPRLSCTTTHISADVQRITLNVSCITISGERTELLDIFCRVTGFTSDFLSFIVVKKTVAYVKDLFPSSRVLCCCFNLHNHVFPKFLSLCIPGCCHRFFSACIHARFYSLTYLTIHLCNKSLVYLITSQLSSTHMRTSSILSLLI